MNLSDTIRSIFVHESDIPDACNVPEPFVQDFFLVNGEFRAWTGPMHPVASPVCIQTLKGIERKIIGSYPLTTETEALETLEAAVRAYDNGQGQWPTMSVEGRIRCIEEFAGRMTEQKPRVVNLLMWEIGKSYTDCVKEFDRTIDYIRDTVDALKELDRVSGRFVIRQHIIGQIRRAPLGVVVCMGPYNYPLNETFTTLIPALIMGNTVILKPPKHGALLYGPLLEAFRDVFPRGVVNVLYGRGREIIPPIMRTGKVNVLALIGSSRAADALRKDHPKPHRLRCVLGLEAKNAAIILPDADLDLTVQECVLGCLSFNGQRCTALKILLVHSDIADQFVERLCRAVEKLKFGLPWEENVFITPLPEPDKPSYLSELVDDARGLGAEVMNFEGGRVEQSFFYPAVLYPIHDGMRVYQEEQFGPVIPVQTFDDLGMPIEYIVKSNYGQQVSIFGTHPDTIAQLIDPLVNQVCRVNLNSQCQRGPDTFPFTGRKDSAESTLSVTDALRAFSIRTMVAGKENPLNKRIINAIVRDRKSNFLSTDFIF